MWAQYYRYFKFYYAGFYGLTLYVIRLPKAKSDTLTNAIYSAIYITANQTTLFNICN